MFQNKNKELKTYAWVKIVPKLFFYNHADFSCYQADIF